jgi:hypothetical protein
MSLPTFHRLAGRQVVLERLRVVSQLVSVSDIRGQIRATSSPWLSAQNHVFVLLRVSIKKMHYVDVH